MTLDPVHVDGIGDLAARISRDVDEAEHRRLAEQVWDSFLDPLYDDGEVVLEPVDALARYQAPVDELGLQDSEFDTVHGLDSGTINPRTFRNGLVLDVAQAAMAATPTDLDLHRSRTVVTTVHSNDATVDTSRDWERFDDGFSRGRVVHLSGLARDQERVVHGLALAFAESAHAYEHADAVEELLVLDGPLYPKAMLRWADRHRDLSDLVTEDPLVRSVFGNYVGLVESLAEREVPLAGFVKSATAQALLRALPDDVVTPWAHDMALFARLLEPAPEGGGGPGDPDARPRRDVLTWTNWFRSRLGADGALAGRGPDLGVTRSLPVESYEVTFFVVYDPRTRVPYRVELPWAVAQDPAVRDAVRTYALSEVAAQRGPPEPVGTADSLARIDQVEGATLVEVLEDRLDTERERTYDDERWGGTFG